VFEERLIYEAQPPVGDAVLAQVEAYCAGPLPEGLTALWRTAFGGALDYALEIELGDAIVEFSFGELFYPESGGYRDLWGWIEHENELAAESPPDLVRRLLKAGAQPDRIAARSAALAGLHESAVLIAQALDKAERRALIEELDPEKFGADGPKINALREACRKIGGAWFGRGS
jgi:hypothetical protein